MFDCVVYVPSDPKYVTVAKLFLYLYQSVAVITVDELEGIAFMDGKDFKQPCFDSNYPQNCHRLGRVDKASLTSLIIDGKMVRLEGEVNAERDYDLVKKDFVEKRDLYYAYRMES